MSLDAKRTYVVPDQTAQVARAIFPKGNPVMRLFDDLHLVVAALSRYAAGAVVNGSLKPYPGQWSPVKSTRDAADSTAAPSPVWG